MKSFIVSLVLATVSVAANAQTMSAPNKGGGRVVLTELPCTFAGKTYPALRAAYSYVPAGSRAVGCWSLAGGKISIAWYNDRPIAEYPVSAFTVDSPARPNIPKEAM